ncbi:MAG: ATP-binding cassette domain-containing protein [Propionibacteriaceae bacterium]|jgi:zinc transport system ATP-binding protein|nr:ATP-binding cassette domain-containing protein [Propionibacteriaceae bacterium]
MTCLSVSNLKVELSGVLILDDVSLEVDDQQTVALLGDNGSGKSTLIKAILSLIPHSAGTIDLLGTAIERFHQWSQIGYVPQRASVSLHSTTVREVVTSGVLANRPIGWPSRRDRRRVDWALETVGLTDQAKQLYLHLSGGQQQRVLIARGIVNQPRFLILDEPFAGVDLINQKDIASSLASLKTTILVVLHETESMAANLDRTVVLRAGRVVYDGAPTTLEDLGSHESQPPARNPLLTGMDRPWIS